MALPTKEYPINYPKDVVKIIDAMKFNIPHEIIVVGSASLKQQKYPADYDAYQYVERNYSTSAECLDSLVVEFQNIISKLLNLSDTYIMDIKAGSVEEWRVIPRNEKDFVVDASRAKLDELLHTKIISKEEYNDALSLLNDYTIAKKNIKFHIVRWTAVEIKLNRKKLRNGKIMTLQQAFSSPTITKLDVISLLNNRYTEFSCIYQFINNEVVLNPDPIDIKKSIVEDLDYYMKEGNFAKILKRRFLLAKYSGDLKTAKKYAEIFNTDLGKLYMLVSDIKTLIDLISEYPRVPIGSLQMELENFIKRLNNIDLKYLAKIEPEALNRIKNILDNPDKKFVSRMQELYDVLNGSLQKEAKKLI